MVLDVPRPKGLWLSPKGLTHGPQGEDAHTNGVAGATLEGVQRYNRRCSSTHGLIPARCPLLVRVLAVLAQARANICLLPLSAQDCHHSALPPAKGWNQYVHCSYWAIRYVTLGNIGYRRYLHHHSIGYCQYISIWSKVSFWHSKVPKIAYLTHFKNIGFAIRLFSVILLFWGDYFTLHNLTTVISLYNHIL